MNSDACLAVRFQPAEHVSGIPEINIRELRQARVRTRSALPGSLCDPVGDHFFSLTGIGLASMALGLSTFWRPTFMRSTPTPANYGRRSWTIWQAQGFQAKRCQRHVGHPRRSFAVLQEGLAGIINTR